MAAPLSRLGEATRISFRIGTLKQQYVLMQTAVEALCVSDHAVPRHLRTIRAKTGARRQTELVRLLMSSPRSLH